MRHFHHLFDMYRHNGLPLPEHPLFSIHRCNDEYNLDRAAFTTDFYIISFKKLKSGKLLYGRTNYDHNTGSMLFLKPRQIMAFRDLEFEEDGFILYIHEDYLHGHFLHKEIAQYSYFDYETDEALHLSPREERIMWELFMKINTEYYDNPDEFSRNIILTHIDSILKYSERFYKRQFINRASLSGTTVSKFNNALSAYFEEENLLKNGLPTVNALASQLNLSPRYLSDMLKQETGKTAIEHIHIYLVNEAKNRIRTEELNISEIAYGLGFENLPYFSRLFKKETGISPSAFRKTLNSN